MPHKKFVLLKTLAQEALKGKRLTVYFVILSLFSILSMVPVQWVKNAGSAMAISIFIILPLEVYITTKYREKRKFKELADPNHPREKVVIPDPLSPRLSDDEMQKIAAQFNRRIVQDKKSHPHLTFRVEFEPNPTHKVFKA